MQTLKLTTAALALSLLAATSFGPHAMAQQGGVEVGGNANNLTLVNRNTNAAIGADAEANTRIGSVQDSKVGGNLNNLTLVNRNTNAAIGKNAEANTQIGAITGAEVGGNLNNLTLVNRNTNAAIGVNSKAGTAIGTVTDAKVGGNLNNLTLVNRNTNAAIYANGTKPKLIDTLAGTLSLEVPKTAGTDEPKSAAQASRPLVMEYAHSIMRSGASVIPCCRSSRRIPARRVVVRSLSWVCPEMTPILPCPRCTRWRVMAAAAASLSNPTLGWAPCGSSV
jgi:hypothetical protein